MSPFSVISPLPTGATHRTPVKRLIERTVFPVAVARQPQGLAARNVVTPEILNRSAARDLQLRRSSRQRHIQQNFSPPALVVPREEFRELPELRAVPLHIELQRSVAQRVRSLPRSTHLQQPVSFKFKSVRKGCAFSRTPQLFSESCHKEKSALVSA